MQILPISKLKDKLNEFVDAVSLTRDQISPPDEPIARTISAQSSALRDAGRDVS
jgi:hypothetical protein